MLFPLGFELAEAVNGHDAIEKVVTFTPDVILMDLFMPVMDGFEATKHIRQILKLRHIIIIAVSASTFQETRQNVMTLGCHDFLEKPVSVETLLEKLHKHLQVEWIYEDERATQEVSQQFAEEPIIPPPRDVLIALFESARKGDIMNIKKYAAHIEQLDRQFIPFATVLHRLAKGFEINNIKRFIQRYMEERYEQ
jgi:CheY-like chemotaxis protein